jgi:hypothetical protein
VQRQPFFKIKPSVTNLANSQKSKDPQWRDEVLLLDHGQGFQSCLWRRAGGASSFGCGNNSPADVYIIDYIHFFHKNYSTKVKYVSPLTYRLLVENCHWHFEVADMRHEM